jgi:ribosomal protein L11 methylase PrmA
MTFLSEQRKKLFWDSKILKWENKRYFQQKCNSLIARRELAFKDLSKIIKGKSVIELGCGSAHLANNLLEQGATHYYGYDFSSKAIQNA